MLFPMRYMHAGWRHLASHTPLVSFVLEEQQRRRAAAADCASVRRKFGLRPLDDLQVPACNLEMVRATLPSRVT